VPQYSEKNEGPVAGCTYLQGEPAHVPVLQYLLFEELPRTTSDHHSSPPRVSDNLPEGLEDAPLSIISPNSVDVLIIFFIPWIYPDCFFKSVVRINEFAIFLESNTFVEPSHCI